MAQGGFCKLPNGTVVVALTLPAPVADAAAPGTGTPGVEGGTVRVLVHAVNRSRALTRLRNLGMRAVYLRGNAHPPTPDEVTAVLHHPDGLIWRTAPLTPGELWHPISMLFATADAPRRPAPASTVPAAEPAPTPGSRPALAGLRQRSIPEPPLTVPDAWTATEA